MTFEEWKKTELDKHWAGSMDPDGEEFAKDAWSYQQEQIAQLQARLESEEAHYARLYCKNQEIHAAALALANVCRSEWDEFADIEAVEVVIEYELVENLLNALR